MKTDCDQPWRCLRVDAPLNHVVLVTAAAGGMGSEIYRFFPIGCATVLGTGHVSYGSGDWYIRSTVHISAEVDDVLADVDPACRRGLDHAIHAAAVIASTRVPAAAVQAWKTVLGINAACAFRLVQRALRRLGPTKRRSIVLIASAAGFSVRGRPKGDSTIVTSKSGDLSLVELTAHAFADSEVRINAIVRGRCDRPMHSAPPAARQKRIAVTTPRCRIRRHEDMAGGALFARSATGPFVHGAELDIDCGPMLR